MEPNHKAQAAVAQIEREQFLHQQTVAMTATPLRQIENVLLNHNRLILDNAIQYAATLDQRQFMIEGVQQMAIFYRKEAIDYHKAAEQFEAQECENIARHCDQFAVQLAQGPKP